MAEYTEGDTILRILKDHVKVAEAQLYEAHTNVKTAEAVLYAVRTAYEAAEHQLVNYKKLRDKDAEKS